MDNFRNSYFQINWDLGKKRLNNSVWGKQYDTGRGLAITLINNGVVVTPSNEIIRLKWEKSDGTAGYVNSTVVSGKFLLENIDQMFTVAGMVKADLELQVAGEFVASVTFFVSVDKAIAVDAIESSSDFTALQEALANVDDVQAQVDAVIANATVDSEVILARGTEPTLGARLDADKAEVSAQLAETGQRIDEIITTPVPVGEIIAQEIIDARQGELSLPANITEVKSQLADKTTKGEVSVFDIDKNLGKFDQTYMTDEFLQQIAGTTPVNAVPADNSITTLKLVDKSVSLEKANFITMSNNLFNPNDVIAGYSFSGTTGELSANATFNASGFISVKPSQTYMINLVGRWVLYDVNKAFISSGATSTFTTPSNVYYARLAVSNFSLFNAQMNIGSTLLAFDDFKAELKRGNFGLSVVPSAKTISKDAMNTDIVDPWNIVSFKKPNNLFNKKDVTLDKKLTVTTGEIVDSATYVLSNNLIKVTPNQVISKSLTSVNVCYYSLDKKYITGVTVGASTPTFTTPNGCEYILVSPVKATYLTFMLNTGSTLLPWEEYIFELVSSNLYPIKIAEGLGGGSGTGSTTTPVLGSQWIYEQNPVLTTGQGATICDIYDPSEIDIIEISSNKKLTEIQIYFKISGVDTLMTLIPSNGGANVACTFANLINEGSSLLEWIECDTTLNKYKICARNINFAEGLRISVKNTDTLSANVSCKVVGRSYETN